MKDTIDRFLGYLQTLLSEYKDTEVKDEEKFLTLFKEELTILPAICKIIIERIKNFLSLKNINGVGLNEFKQWLGLIEYWQKYVDNLIEEHSLLNSEWDIEGLEDAIS